MNTSLTPLNARLRFALKHVSNWSLAVFLAGFSAFAFFCILGNWMQFVADALAIGIVACFLMLVWKKRAIRLNCPSCEKVILSNTPWLCPIPRCRHHNIRVHMNPFLGRCERCSFEPKTYQCHHCQKPVFLTEDEDMQNVAVCLNAPKPKLPEHEHFEKMDQMQREIAERELTSRLETTRNRADSEKKKPVQQEIEESFTNHQAKFMGAREFAREQKAANAVKYADDPEACKMADESVDEWLRSKV